MGIKKFFKKIGNGIKKGASVVKDKFHKVASGVKKFAKPLLNVANKVSGYLQYVPGVVGQVAGWVNKGTDVAKDVVDKLPNGKVKNKVNGVIDKVSNTANQGLQKGSQYADKAANLGRKIDNGIKVGQQMGNAAQSGIKSLINQT